MVPSAVFPWGFMGLLILLAVIITIKRRREGRDHARWVDAHIERLGGKLLWRQKDPLGLAWFDGSKDSWFSSVIYRDAEGQVHRVTAKTRRTPEIQIWGDEILEGEKLKSLQQTCGFECQEGP